MPGLKQLEQFVSEVRKLGDEDSIRAKKGEKIYPINLPQGVADVDDSDDFILGLPENDKDSKSIETDSENTDELNDEVIPVNDFDDEQVDLSDFMNESNSSSSDDISLDDLNEFTNNDSLDESLKDISDDNGINEDLFNEDFTPQIQNEDINQNTELSQESFDMNDFPSDAIQSDDSLNAIQSEEPLNTIQSDNSLNAIQSDNSLNAVQDDNPISDLNQDNDNNMLGDMEDFGNFGEEFVDNSENSENDNLLVNTDFDKSETSNISDDFPDVNEQTIDIGEDAFNQLEGESVPNDVPVNEEIDISDMDNIDFTNSSNNEKSDFDPNNIPVTGENSSEDDFLLADDFEIPGFSDTESADFGKSKKVDTVDFKSEPKKQKTSLTEQEYELFKRNLSEYPLNLKIVIEDVISKDDSSSFTDEVLFDIIERVLKKTPARQLATHMEKLLDISINIPRDFEHRSYAQYEAYKASFQYQLKNRIIPGALILIFALLIGFSLFKLGKRFIYEPVMARLYYKEGYELIENNEYVLSEDKFDKAVSYQPVKKWFFKYARGYREHKQYERSAKMYKNILAYFNYDKQAGLEYAEMELYDRANYQEAEKIVRRYVLDHHINDPSGVLLLGDIFLEWAEEDPEKYAQAFEYYNDLIKKYPKENDYISRMLRYYIRTDQLKEVLEYKTMFYPKKSSLSANDWIELSGYLLDKLYGSLNINDQYLRSSIEDVRAMLEIAIKADPMNPIARYNLSRYFIQNGYMDQAKIEMSNALRFFKNLKVRSKKNIYKEINASRILGEIYADETQYVEAQEIYTSGINLFNDEHQRTGLEGDENTGKLFADMGDIDYFISGDIDSALANYETAVRSHYDIPSVNFRIGAIRYSKKDLDSALASFIKVSETNGSDINLLISLGNVLSLRGDNFAAQSYYSELLRKLDIEKERLGNILVPQVKEDDNKVVDLYLKANNNLGVTLYRLAKQTGNSDYNAQAMVRLSDSMRAWDALTRDQKTMIKMEGGNLAAQNSKFLMAPYSEFEPAIYTDIPRILTNEKVLENTLVKPAIRK